MLILSLCTKAKMETGSVSKMHLHIDNLSALLVRVLRKSSSRISLLSAIDSNSVWTILLLRAVGSGRIRVFLGDLVLSPKVCRIHAVDKPCKLTRKNNIIMLCDLQSCVYSFVLDSALQSHFNLARNGGIWRNGSGSQFITTRNILYWCCCGLLTL